MNAEGIFSLYSVQQKHCPITLKEKSLVFSVVNFHETLHASTCTMYTYIPTVKKPAAASGRPPGAARRGRLNRTHAL